MFFHSTGLLVWRRHVRGPPPSLHAIRSTCMQLLPLVEMYCRYELQEDCTGLRDLLLRFDSELELGLHALGRSLLNMVREDAENLDILPRPAPFVSRDSPFDVVREKLRAAGTTITNLRQQVQQFLVRIFSCGVAGIMCWLTLDSPIYSIMHNILAVPVSFRANVLCHFRPHTDLNRIP